MPGNPLNLGQVIGGKGTLTLPPSARERHLYVCGGTGVGKSKFLEGCVRQDIVNWRDSGCGLLLLDPHGLVYQNTLAWLARHGLKRPVVPIDLRRDDRVVAYNPLRNRPAADPAVVVSNFVKALAHVWGQGGTDDTPLFARWASVLLHTLYASGHTVADVMPLLTRPEVRQAMAGKVQDDTVQHAWAFAARQPKEFEQQVTSTLNRFQRLLGPQALRAAFGQPDASLDLSAALEEGHILLVNLSTEGGTLDEEGADTFATLLLADLWAAAKARGKRERHRMRPFYVYVDECQNFVTPTIAQNLDQARGFGLHLTLANQFPSQFLAAGPSGRAMYDSVLANTGTKVVFRVEHPADAEPLARQLFTGTFDPDQVKLKVFATKVLGYREEVRESTTTGTTRTSGGSSTTGGGKTEGEARSTRVRASAEVNLDVPVDQGLAELESWNRDVAKSTGENETWSYTDTYTDADTKSVTRTPTLIPELGSEVSSVHFRSVEEQLFRAVQRLSGQADRQFVVRYPGGPVAPLFVRTPDVAPARDQPERTEKYLRGLVKNLPYVLSMEEALKRLEERHRKLGGGGIDPAPTDEPKSHRRRVL